MNRFDVIESLERRTCFSPLLFSNPASFPTGTNPSDVVTASLTNNGISDVITTNFGAASIAVLRGNGNGTFQAPVYYPVGNQPEALAVGDFTGNGITDIVTANEGDNTISVLMGNGDGTFAPAVTYAVGLRPEAIAVGNLNGGLPDIVVADEGASSVDVLINNGNGTFQPPVTYAAGANPDGVALGDFTGSGLDDIVVINPLGSYCHVLLNAGNGTFDAAVAYTTDQTARAVAVADINSDGRPDIITTSLQSTQIDILYGEGNGTFDNLQTYGTGFFPYSIAVADMNGDGRVAVVTANELDNTVGVLLHTGTATFVPSIGFHGGLAPVAVAVADFNGDGKPDIVAADFNTNSVSVLTNQTVFPTLIPTTVALTSNQNPVEFGNRDVLTAQVNPSSIDKRRPIGVVVFFNGDAVIGISPVSSSGVATIAPTTLALGDHTITAEYMGDGLYKAATSSEILEQVVAAVQTVPLVQPGILSVRLAKQYVPGDRGVANVAITDVGDGPANGVVGLQLYASTSSTFDSTAFPITINGRGKVAVHLAGGRVLVDPVTFTMPTSIEPGNYTIFAALSPVSGLTAGEVNSTPAVGLNSSVAVLEFGTVPTHANYKLTRTLANGSTISLSMAAAGSGTGTVTENSDGGISVVLTGTAPFSRFTISGGPVTLDSLTDNAPIGHVDAPTAALAGSLAMNGSVGYLTLAGATNSSIFLNGGAIGSNVDSLGTVTNTALYSAAAIKSLNVTSWSSASADSVTTAWITTITSAGDFGPAMTINAGVGPRDESIGSVKVGGTLLASTWSIQKNIGLLQVGGIASGWSGSIHGTIYSLIDTGDFAGNLAALDLGTVRISGNLTDANILAGADFGPTATLSPNGDYFGRGILTSLVVNGSVTGSLVAAGLSPVGDDLLGPGTMLLPRSAIKSIAISGSVDATSKLVAVALPVKAMVDGLEVATTGDGNFQL